MESIKQEKNQLVNECVQDEKPTTSANSKQCNDQINKPLKVKAASKIKNKPPAQSNDTRLLKFKHLCDHLAYLRRTIYNVLKDDSQSSSDVFSRVSKHVFVFHSFVLTNCDAYFENEQWDDVVWYIFMALQHLCNTPRWNDDRLRRSRREIFCRLIRSCLKALKKLKENGTYSTEKYQHFVLRLKLQCTKSKDEFVKIIQPLHIDYLVSNSNFF